MSTAVYKNKVTKNADMRSHSSCGAPLGYRNSNFVNPGSLALTSPAGDQIGCFSHSSDIYMRNVNRNTIDTEKTNCLTSQPFYRESQLEGGRASNLAMYANATVGAAGCNNRGSSRLGQMGVSSCGYEVTDPSSCSSSKRAMQEVGFASCNNGGAMRGQYTPSVMMENYHHNKGQMEQMRNREKMTHKTGRLLK